MNPYIFDPKTSPATFVPPRTIEEQLEWARKVDEWVRQRDAEWERNNTMDTLTMTTDQLHYLIDVLDEVMRQEEPSYVEWCSHGNDPADHLWYRTAHAASVLEQS